MKFICCFVKDNWRDVQKMSLSFLYTTLANMLKTKVKKLYYFSDSLTRVVCTLFLFGFIVEDVTKYVSWYFSFSSLTKSFSPIAPQITDTKTKCYFLDFWITIERLIYLFYLIIWSEISKIIHNHGNKEFIWNPKIYSKTCQYA